MINNLTDVRLISAARAAEASLSLLRTVGIGGLAPTNKTSVKLAEGHHTFRKVKEDNLTPMRKGEMRNPKQIHREEGDVRLSPHKFEEKVRWYHVSPYRLKAGDVLKPGVKDKNFPNFSGNRVYISTSPYTHWTLAGSKVTRGASFLYEVKPTSKPQPGDYMDHHCKEAVVLRSMGQSMSKTGASDTRVNKPRKWVEKLDIPPEHWDNPKAVSAALSECNAHSSSQEVRMALKWYTEEA